MAENLMSKASIVDHPYLVYKNNQELISQISGNLVTTLPTLTSLEGETLSIIEAQMINERAKEEKFIQQVEQFLTDKQLSGLYQEGNYSQMITLFDAYKKGIIKEVQTFKEAMDAINSYYKNFNFKASKQFILDFFQEHNNQLLNTSVDNLFDRLASYSEDKYKDPKVQGIVKKSVEELKKSYFEKKNHLEHSYTFSKEDLIRVESQKTDKKTIMEKLQSDLHGIFSGMVGEIAVGGGNIGTQLKGGKNPDTDTIHILSTDLTFEMNDREELLAMQSTYEEMREIEKTFEDCYIIHYSVKAGTGSNIKIKDESSYQKRIEDIRTMFQSLHISNFQDFIFTLANTIPEMAAENRWEDIKNSVIQLTSIYMFDDILPSVAENIENETYNTKKLNFYNIGGKIFTASEILNLLMNQADSSIKRGRPNIVSLTRSGKSVDYDCVTKGIDDSEARWNAVYEAGMTSNKFSMIRLNVNNLIKLLLTP